MSVRVKELIRTIQGEGIWSGYPCTLLRLSGCNLRCSYCDTTYAYEGGRYYNIDTLTRKIRKMGDDLILLTGGEPLIQEETKSLLRELIKCGANVILETNGSISIRGLPAKVHIVMDIKCPGSGEAGSNLWKNLDWIKLTDEIKFVLAGREDYQWAKDQIRKRSLAGRARISFSPVFGKVPHEELASWIIKDRLQVRLNLQLHKIIWGDADKRR